MISPAAQPVTQIPDVTSHAVDRWHQRFGTRISLESALRRAVPVELWKLRREARTAGEKCHLHQSSGTVFLRDEATGAVFVCKPNDLWCKAGRLNVVTVVKWKYGGTETRNGGES